MTNAFVELSTSNWEVVIKFLTALEILEKGVDTIGTVISSQSTEREETTEQKKIRVSNVVINLAN